MALVKTVDRQAFDTLLIQKGDLIYVTYSGWDEPKRGIVLHVSEDTVVFLYHPGISNVTNRHTLKASEVASGEYSIRWSTDLETVYQYPALEEEGDADDA